MNLLNGLLASKVVRRKKYLEMLSVAGDRDEAAGDNAEEIVTGRKHGPEVVEVAAGVDVGGAEFELDHRNRSALE